MTLQRLSGQRYPWYDSLWLTRYVQAKQLLQRIRPEKLTEFIGAFKPLRTHAEFFPVRVESVFSDSVMSEIRRAIATLKPLDLELHEARRFGRFVVHNHEYFTDLQRSVVGLVSEAVGETVEPSYNFLSMYTKNGVVPIHMDAPNAKWTLDICVNQPTAWPIFLSQVNPWPEDLELPPGDWESGLKESIKTSVRSYALEPGNGLVFSGSSQWHYREPLLSIDPKVSSCDFLFFHFIPKGSAAIVKPKNWAQLFGVPELADPATDSQVEF
jgi:hypothetical protein